MSAITLDKEYKINGCRAAALLILTVLLVMGVIPEWTLVFFLINRHAFLIALIFVLFSMLPPLFLSVAFLMGIPLIEIKIFKLIPDLRKRLRSGAE